MMHVSGCVLVTSQILPLIFVPWKVQTSKKSLETLMDQTTELEDQRELWWWWWTSVSVPLHETGLNFVHLR